MKAASSPLEACAITFRGRDFPCPIRTRCGGGGTHRKTDEEERLLRGSEPSESRWDPFGIRQYPLHSSRNRVGDRPSGA